MLHADDLVRLAPVWRELILLIRKHPTWGKYKGPMDIAWCACERFGSGAHVTGARSGSHREPGIASGAESATRSVSFARMRLRGMNAFSNGSRTRVLPDALPAPPQDPAGAPRCTGTSSRLRSSASSTALRACSSATSTGTRCAAAHRGAPFAVARGEDTANGERETRKLAR